MPTPLQGIATPLYGPSTWDDLATMAAQLEALGVPRFASAGERDNAIVAPQRGQCCAVDGNFQMWSGAQWAAVQGGGSAPSGGSGPSISLPLGVGDGGTGATNATNALTNLGAAPATHKHAAADITSGVLGTAQLPSISYQNATFSSGWGTPSQGPAVGQIMGLKVLAAGLVGPTASFAISNLAWQTIATTQIMPSQNLNLVGWHISLNIAVICRWDTTGALRIMTVNAATIPAVSGTAYIVFPAGVTP